MLAYMERSPDTNHSNDTNKRATLGSAISGLCPKIFNKILMDFYPKDIKEIAAVGGSWGVFIASQEII